MAIVSPISSTASHSSVERGLSSAHVVTFCCSCSMLDMPESTIVTWGTVCRKRKAQVADSAGPLLLEQVGHSAKAVLGQVVVDV